MISAMDAIANAKKANKAREEKKTKVVQSYINAKIRRAVKQGKSGVVINRRGFFSNRFDPNNLKIDWLLELGYNCDYCDTFDILAIYWEDVKI